ncbi:MAG: DUF4136 domain-containing protein [Halomonadaceae bacterium]|nr:MAG: DUF4136 domain-containing protein [Halomonadaceae bacterium]
MHSMSPIFEVTAMDNSRLSQPSPAGWRYPALIVMVLLLLSGCARYVVTDHDSRASFEQYQTYTLVGKDEQDPDRFQTLDSARIESALRRELNQQVGMRFVDDREEADLLVRYRIEDARRTESTGASFGVGFGRSPFGFGVASAPPTREVKEGKLVVELVDSNNRQVVWRGTGQQNLEERMSPDQRTRLIDRLAKEMFQRYPPN